MRPPTQVDEPSRPRYPVPSPTEGTEASPAPEDRSSVAPIPPSLRDADVRPFLDAGTERTRVELIRQSNREAPAGRLDPAAVELPAVGERFLDFTLVEQLGKGSFGRVFLATQEGLGRRKVALKIAPDIFDESQSLAQLQHANIVPIYSAHSRGSLQAICMPYLGRTTLADVCRAISDLGEVPQSGRHLVSTLRSRFSSSGSGSAEPDRPKSADVPPAGEVSPPSGGTLERIEESSYLDAVLGMGAKVARGLHHAHERGIIHRDLKPANILLTDDAQPMILDFNLAEDHKVEPELRRIRFGGTIPYMSPEQLESYQGRPVPLDRRSDVYALGVILVQLTTGVYPFPPFEGGASRVVPRILASRWRDLPAPRRLNPAISRALEAILLKAIAPNPDDRYRTAQELAEDLERQRTHQPPRYAPEPSLGEWLRKWRCHRPRGGSSPTRACLAASVFLASLAAFVGSSPGSPQRESRRAEVDERLRTSPPADAARDAKRAAADSLGLVARGVAHLPADPLAALADFREAERLSPRAIEPIQHQAHVLGEYLGDDRGALECMDRLLRAHPDYPLGRAGRAVHLARVGEIDAAIRDARAALDLSAGPEIQYRVACVYALAAATHPECRPEALALLSQALQRGYGHQHLGDDGDLDPLRDDPDFDDLLSYVNKLRNLQKVR